MSNPKPGEVYRHINGNFYEVMFLANTHSQHEDYPVTVIYRGANLKIWAKPLSNFNLKMTKV